MSSPKYRMLLRTVYAGIISSKLTASELKSLVNELRRGRLPDELAYMLDQTTRHLMPEGDDEANEEAINNAESLVKMRKLSRSALSNILQSLGGAPQSRSASVRTQLSAFASEAPPSRLQKLLEVLESPSENDAFLSGISSTRK